MAGMAAGDAVQPSFDATGQCEIGRVDREDERAVEDAAVEPLRQDELHAVAVPARIDQLLQFVVQENCILRQFTP